MKSSRPEPEVRSIVLKDDGTFPNDLRPLLLYLQASPDFRIVGAYPRGQRWDMCYGEAGERPRVDHNISAVPDPQIDPVQGSGGALPRLWRIP